MTHFSGWRWIVRLSNRCLVRPPTVRPSAALLPGALLFLALLPVSVQAQSVFGRVIVEGDTLGVSGAELTLSDSTGIPVAKVQSNETGHFRLPAPGGGRFVIRVSRIGFSAIEAEAILREEETLEVELRMAVEAIPLEPILVVARREIKHGTLDQFYDRMARNKQRGKGQFLTREQIEARRGSDLGLIMQTIPGVWAQGRDHYPMLANPSAGGGIFCRPDFFLDGMPMLSGFRNFDYLDMEGIEVYRGYSESVDGEFPNRCGQVFLWRRSDWGNPFTWKRGFVALGLGAILWALTGII